MTSAFSKMNGSDRFAEDIPLPETPAQKEQKELLEALDQRKYDHANPPERPEPIFKLCGQSIATPGNLVVIQGKAKSAKTALIEAMIGRVISDDDSGDYFELEAKLNPEGKALIHFDCEQSRYDADQVIRKALRRGNISECPAWIRSYCLTDIDRRTRRKMLLVEMERAGQECDGIYGVVLDGVGDLALNVNDPEEANGFVAELHAQAIKCDTVIACVLHENPGENQHGKTRGHLGSELERKAETNLRLEKDKDEVTTVWSERSRHCSIPKDGGVTFKWSDEDKMHRSCAPSSTVKSNARIETLRLMAVEVFNCEEAIGGLTWTQVHERIELLCNVKREGARKQFKNLKENSLMKQNCANLWTLAGN
jgi:hypothetical protein